MRVLFLGGADAAGVQVELVIRQLDGAIDVVTSIDEAWAAVSINVYDVLVVDIDTVAVDAFIRKLRIECPGLRVIVLGSRDAMDRIATAMRRGADEFLIKPIDFEELRLRASGLGSVRKERQTAALACGPLRLQLHTRDVSLDGHPVNLSPRERAVLQVLLRERGKVVSKDYIASRIFSIDDEARPSAIETYVSRLRRKTAHPHLEIRTVHGVGYLLMNRP